MSKPPWDDESGETDLGRCRAYNEDGYLLRSDLGLAVVVDASGAHGEPMRIALACIEGFFERAAVAAGSTWPYAVGNEPGAALLTSAIKLANHRIFEAMRQDPKTRGLCATLVAALAYPEGCFVAHVGDCRAYRFRAGTLERLTQDHSLLNEYLKMKTLSPEEIEAFPHKNVMVRALGAKASVLVDCQRAGLLSGDLLLLCSDGLHAAVSEPRVASILASASSLRSATHRLIAEANDRGGRDNITAVLLRWR